MAPRPPRPSSRRTRDCFPLTVPLVEGRKAIGEFWQGAFDAGIHSLELGKIAVEVHGDTMIETGTWAVKVPNSAGGEDSPSGKALVVWKKGEDGVWRMSQDMWNDGL